MTTSLPPGSFTAPHPEDSCHSQPDAPAERIGECDLCGEVDHHLVQGSCETCRRHYRMEAGQC